MPVLATIRSFLIRGLAVMAVVLTYALSGVGAQVASVVGISALALTTTATPAQAGTRRRYRRYRRRRLSSVSPVPLRLLRSPTSDATGAIAPQDCWRSRSRCLGIRLWPVVGNALRAIKSRLLILIELGPRLASRLPPPSCDGISIRYALRYRRHHHRLEPGRNGTSVSARSRPRATFECGRTAWAIRPTSPMPAPGSRRPDCSRVFPTSRRSSRSAPASIISSPIRLCRRYRLVRIVDPDLTMRMTEYVVLHALIHHRRLRLYDDQQRRRLWLDHPQPAANEVNAGVMGLGVLGRDCCARARSRRLSGRRLEPGRKGHPGHRDFRRRRRP